MFPLETDSKLQLLCDEYPDLTPLFHQYEQEVEFLFSRLTHEITPSSA